MDPEATPSPMRHSIDVIPDRERHGRTRDLFTVRFSAADLLAARRGDRARRRAATAATTPATALAGTDRTAGPVPLPTRPSAGRLPWSRSE
ncbi:hypothetical protein QOM21_04285 [Streptomyces sp. Pv4-95]|uniref:hypothetical protein n=1 Tax=Streptomyces sp. Pv4-95 TaxID=3049543 RepID=UPI003891DDE9